MHYYFAWKQINVLFQIEKLYNDLFSWLQILKRLTFKINWPLFSLDNVQWDQNKLPNYKKIKMTEPDFWISVPTREVAKAKKVGLLKSQPLADIVHAVTAYK